MIKEVTSKNHLETLISEKHELIMVLFYKASSPNSQKAFQALTDLEESHSDTLIYGVNVEKVMNIHGEFGITMAPTVVVFRHGKPAEYVYGVQTTAYYSKLLQEFTVSSNGNGKATSHPRVTVYTTPTCPHCTSVKRYLDSHSISFNEVNVAADQSAAQALVNRTGQQGVPQTEINGQFVIGYNTAELDRLLNL